MPFLKVRVSNKKLMEIGRQKLQSSIKRAPSRTARKLALELLKGRPEITKYGNINVPKRLVTEARVDLLLSRLKNPNRDVSYAAQEELNSMKAPDTIPNLIPRLRAMLRSKGDLPVTARGVLIGTRLRSTIPNLKAALKDRYWPVRYYAIRILGEMKVRAVIPDLKLAARSPKVPISEAAEIALRKMNVKI